MTPDFPPPREPCAVYELSAAELDAVSNEEVAVEVGGRKIWVARTEVTQAAWSEIMNRNPETTFDGCGPDLPIASVSWFDAMRYANRLSHRQGLRPAYRLNERRRRWQLDPRADGYRLPTVEEWTQAVMGGHSLSEADLCISGNILDETAARTRLEIAGTLVRGRSGEYELLYATCDDGYAQLAPVGAFISPSGLVYDGIGNVEEWVELNDGSGAVATMGGSYSMTGELDTILKPSKMSPTMVVGGLRLVRNSNKTEGGNAGPEYDD